MKREQNKNEYLKSNFLLIIRIGTFGAACLMIVMSVMGLFFTDSIYATPAQVQAYKANDLLNLLIGLPVLLGAMSLAGRGRLIGLLFWPGGILYVLYNYTAMLVGGPSGWPRVVFGVLVLVCVYLLVTLFRSIDASAVQARLAGKVVERLSGGVLVLFGIGFSMLAAGVITDALLGKMVSMPDVGVSAGDILLSLLFITAGILFLLRKPYGYASGPGMLFTAMVLFTAVILLVVIRPWFSGPAFNWEDVIALGSMAVVCLVPFGLMTRGILSEGK